MEFHGVPYISLGIHGRIGDTAAAERETGPVLLIQDAPPVVRHRFRESNDGIVVDDPGSALVVGEEAAGQQQEGQEDACGEEHGAASSVRPLEMSGMARREWKPYNMEKFSVYILSICPRPPPKPRSP